MVRELIEMIMKERGCSVYMALLIFCDIRDKLREESV